MGQYVWGCVGPRELCASGAIYVGVCGMVEGVVWEWGNMCGVVQGA